MQCSDRHGLCGAFYMPSAKPGITLHFSGIHRGLDITLGPHSVVMVSGNFMTAERADTVIANYVRHQWRVGQDHFSSYRCHDPTMIHFEDQAGLSTERFGPFEELFVADGTMYADNELFAKFIDETVLWHSFRLETWWPRLVISFRPAAREPPDGDGPVTVRARG